MSDFVVNPFVSEAQRAWMHANHPQMAERWEKHTPKGKKLPKRKGIVANSRALLKRDPTRTSLMRRAFAARLKRQFARLKGRIIALIVKEDALGLRARNPLIHNTRWALHDDEAKLTSFKRWLKSQIDIDLRSQPEEELWRRYIEQGYRKGQNRVYQDVNRARGKQAFGKIGDEEAAKAVEEAASRARDLFLRGPASQETVRALVTRTWNEMEDVSARAQTKLTRALADGLTQGKTPEQIARDIADELDIEQNRALLIARTELVRAHAEGQLDALEALGQDEVGVAVEWTTADNPCPECEPLDGVILDIDEARGMLPRHPGCLCSFTPVEREDRSKADARSIRDAIRESQDVRDDESWGPAVPVRADTRNTMAAALEVLDRYLGEG